MSNNCFRLLYCYLLTLFRYGDGNRNLDYHVWPMLCIVVLGNRGTFQKLYTQHLSTQNLDWQVYLLPYLGSTFCVT